MTETSRPNRACAGSGSIWGHSSSDYRCWPSSPGSPSAFSKPGRAGPPLRVKGALEGTSGFGRRVQLVSAKRSSRSILESLKGFARGARPARAVVTPAVGMSQPGRPIRRPQQQLEECPVSLVFGSGSAAVRTLHDNLPFGRAHAPPPSPASFLQDHFKNRKLIGHCHRSIDRVEFHICVVPSRRRVQNSPRGRQNSTAMPE
jgi:hypothetical protein